MNYRGKEYTGAWPLAAAIALCAAAFAADLAIPRAVAGGVLYLLPILVTLWVPGIAATVAFGTVALALTLLGYFIPPPGAELWQVVTNRALVFGAIIATAAVVASLKSRRTVRTAQSTPPTTLELHHDFYGVAESMPGICWIMDPGYRVVYVNAQARAFAGIDGEHDLGARWHELIHPDDRAAMWAVVEDHFRSIRPFEVEFRLQRSSGGYAEILAQGRPFFGEHGELTGYVATGMDVSAQKRTERDLRDSEAFLSRAQHLASVGNWIWDSSTNSIRWSEQMDRIFGISQDSAKPTIESVATEIIHPDDREVFAADWKELLRTKVPRAGSYRIIRPDGEVRLVQAEFDVDLDESGVIARILGTTQDITERMRAEQALHDSRDLLAWSERLALVGSWIWRVGDKAARWSDGLYALAGRRADTWSPTIGNIYRDLILAEDIEHFENDWRRVRRGEDVVSEFRMRRLDGTIRWVRELRSLTFGPTGEVTQIVGATRDITFEREAAQALSDSRERLAYAESVARLGHSDWDVQTGKEVWSDELYRLLGTQPGAVEPSLSTFLDLLVNQQDRERLQRGRGLVASGDASPGALYHIRGLDGRERDLQVGGQVECDDKGAVVRVFATAQDVTDLNEAQRALQSSERRFDLAARGTNDGLWDWLNIDEEPFWLSERYYQLLGYEVHAFGGSATKVGELIHPDDFEAVAIALDAHLRGGREFDVEHRLLTSSGEYRWFRSRGAAAEGDDGKSTRLAGSSQDVHARHMAELEVEHHQAQLRGLAARAALAAEKERRRIGAELHDRTIQNLGITKVKLGALRDLATQTGNEAAYDAVAQVLDATIQDARLLLSEISPPVLTELGFEAAVDWLAERAEGQYGVHCTVSDDGQPRLLDEDAQLVLFQAVRELLANVGKHARAGSAHVLISGAESRVVVQVVDDGVGFEAAAVERTAIDEGGYGLFSIRERLRMLGGVLQIESHPDAGTRVTVTVPIRH